MVFTKEQAAAAIRARYRDDEKNLGRLLALLTALPDAQLQSQLCSVDDGDDAIIACVEALTSSTPAGVSPAELLSSPLDCASPEKTTGGPHHTPYSQRLHEVVSWSLYNEKLEEEILHHQLNANVIYGQQRFHPMQRDYVSTFSKEADVSRRLEEHVCERLTRLCRCLAEMNHCKPIWKLEACHKLAQAIPLVVGAVQAVQRDESSANDVPADQQSDLATTRRRRSPSPLVHQTACEPHSGSTSSRLRADLALTVETEQGQRVICIGEVKRNLFNPPQGDGAAWSAWDLVDLWNEQNVPARDILSQIHTYLLAWKVQYGFISCWYATWLVHCPATSREALYVSPAYRSSTESTSTQPKVTAMGALAWLQYQAVKAMHTEVDECPEIRSSIGDMDHDYESPADDGELEGSGEEYSPRDSPKSGGRSLSNSHAQRQRKQSGGGNRRRDTLMVKEVLGSGDYGTVAQGVYNNVPAVFKFFGPMASSIQAYRRELAAYACIHDLQQKGTVPELLGHGKVDHGIRVLALRCINGVLHSAIRCTFSAQQASLAAEAAQQALKALHEQGVLHGDVHGDNLMFSIRDDGVACVVLDFGRASLRPTAEEQERELARLRRLLS